MRNQYHRYSPFSHLQKIWTNGEMRVVGLLQPQHILGTFLHSSNACQYYSETKEQMIRGGSRVEKVVAEIVGLNAEDLGEHCKTWIEAM